MSEEEKRDSVISKLGDALKKVSSKKKIAEKLHRSYELEKLRKEAIEKGALPWSIIRYRHILEPKDCPLPLTKFDYVTPKAFEQHLRYIASVCTPLPLAELIRLVMKDEDVPDRAIALTFDGGHADFFLNALPLLLKYKIPATLCFPTAYIEAPSYLPEDRLAIALFALKRMKQPFPRFDFLPEELYENVEKISPKLKITDALVPYLIDQLRGVDEEKRFRVLSAFASELGEVVELPDYEDFVRWDDIAQMKDMGVTFATMGHSYLIASGTPPELYKKDVLQSIQVFSEKALPLEKYFCFVDGVCNQESLDTIKSIGFLVALTIGDAPKPEEQPNELKLLGRVGMFQDVAETEALFACRAWRIIAEDHEF